MKIIEKTTSGVTTQILSCVCKHEFQDKEYGKGKRLFNNNTKGARCTVCSIQVLQKG